jgi:Fe2+ transport system protein B
MDSLNPLVAGRGTAVLTSVKAQASLLAIRDIYGVLIITCFVFLLFILVFPFHGSKKRSIFNWTNPVFGKEVAQTIPI